MRRFIVFSVVVASALLLVLQPFGTISAAGPKVLVIEVDGAIEPLTADHITRGIDEARKGKASLVVIELNTPGGFLDSTRNIVESLLASEIPVAVYVSPGGVRRDVHCCRGQLRRNDARYEHRRGLSGRVGRRRFS